MPSVLIKDAIILAGGLGTRLRSVVPELPKCMAPVNGKPFLHYVIQYLQKEGIKNFIFSLGYKHEYISEWLAFNYDPSIYSTIVEEEPLGTGGAILKSCNAIHHDNVFITNGDTMFTISLPTLSKMHIENQAACTLALKPMSNFDRYGVVTTNANQQITSFKEKMFYKEGLINGGLYALNVTSFKQYNWPEKFSFEKNYLEKSIDSKSLYGFKEDAYFIDIGIPEDFQRVQKEFAEGMHLKSGLRSL